MQHKWTQQISSLTTAIYYRAWKIPNIFQAGLNKYGYLKHMGELTRVVRAFVAHELNYYNTEQDEKAVTI